MKEETKPYEIKIHETEKRTENVVKMPEIQENKPEQVYGYQTNSSKDYEKAPNQKIKIYSSNKRRNNYSSNKSSPAGGQISNEKQENNQQPDVKTNPFTPITEPSVN